MIAGLDYCPGVMTQAGTHSVSRWRRAGWFALAVLAWFLALAVALWLAPSTKPTPLWEATNGRAVPSDFLYLMYPASASVRVFDRPDGNDVGALTRAVACKHEKLNADGWVGVWTPTQSVWVRRTDLRFETSDLTGSYFRAYEKIVEAQSVDGFGGASISANRDSKGVTTIRFERFPDDDHVERYLYQVSNGVATPVEVDHAFGPGEALADIPGFLVALIVATMVAILVRRFGRWRMRAKVLQQPEGATA